jgi:nitronate monooxygenase
VRSPEWRVGRPVWLLRIAVPPGSFGYGQAQFLTGELKCVLPMALISGGRLAAALTSGGGLGLLGGGYGDSDWLRREFGLAEGARVGCGFITSSLARKPELLVETLARQPATIMLSFGDLRPFADRIHAAGVPLIAQVQTLDHANEALDAGADILIAQGG